MQYPLVSVIMAVRNEEKYVARSLQSIFGQDYPADRLEVLVSDGMSRDRTRALIAEIAARHPASYVWVQDNPGRTVPHGLNLLLAHSRGEIIIRVDARTEIAPAYVRPRVDLLENTAADNVGGRSVPKATDLRGWQIAIAI